MSPSSATEEKKDVADSIGHGQGWVVTVFNDEIHTFDEVERQLMKAINCSLSQARCWSNEIHSSGAAIVFQGGRPLTQSPLVLAQRGRQDTSLQRVDQISYPRALKSLPSPRRHVSPACRFGHSALSRIPRRHQREELSSKARPVRRQQR